MRFFILEEPKATETRHYATWTHCNASVGEAPRCSACGAYTGLLPSLPPYAAELLMLGTTPQDLLFGSTEDLLVSERFKSRYQESGLTGLTGFDPVEIKLAKRSAGSKMPLPEYFIVNAIHSKTRLDDKKSGIEREKLVCQQCLGPTPKRAQRIVVDESTWTGEDLFIATGFPGTIICSDRFRAFCDHNRFAGIVLVPSEEARLPEWYREGTHARPLDR